MNISIPQSFDELEKLKDYIQDADSDFLRLPHDKEFFGLFMKLIPKSTSIQMINEQMHEQEIALIRNNFPYTFLLQKLPKITHYCLWSKKGELSDDEISKIVRSQFPNNKWFHIERNPDKKSVPEIWHTHVFIEEYE